MAERITEKKILEKALAWYVHTFGWGISAATIQIADIDGARQTMPFLVRHALESGNLELAFFWSVVAQQNICPCGYAGYEYSWFLGRGYSSTMADYQQVGDHLVCDYVFSCLKKGDLSTRSGTRRYPTALEAFEALADAMMEASENYRRSYRNFLKRRQKNGFGR